MEVEVPFQSTFTLGQVVTVLTIIGSVVGVLAGLRKLLWPLYVRFDEHDILWEEYSVKNGRTYRRSRGRGRYESSTK